MPEGDNEPQFVPVGSQRRVTTYRVARPHAGIVSTGAGRFEATEYADRRTGIRGRLLGAKDAIVGSAVSNVRLAEERLSKRIALAVFSSDALSSTAYATQEIILILVIAGTSALSYSVPISICIVVLLGLVVASYRQTIRAYPKGGGGYIVAHENLGRVPGLAAASALLIDYVLTTSVSISACVDAIVAAAPGVDPLSVPLAVSLVLAVALLNLRGIRESGVLFAIPTYGFIFVLGGTLVVGIITILFSDNPNVFAVGEPTKEVEPQQALTLFLILRAFSAGCTALTGVEAISNGVSAFKKPEPWNAATTLTTMAIILGTLFVGTTLLARHFGIVYEHGDTETVMAQIGTEVYGKNIMFYLLQAFTAAILFLAANTAYNGFPLLAALLARDGYLPRFFHQRGNRLVFSYGIAALTLCAITLIIAFGASTTRLIPLYALGVFLTFTLAQIGMVKRWYTLRESGWKRSMTINAIGGFATATVFLIILATKFLDGGWMVTVAIPLISFWLYRIAGFYRRMNSQLRVQPGAILPIRPEGPSRIPALVPVEDINLPTVFALSAACARSSDVAAVHIHYDAEDEASDLQERWNHQFPDIPLIVIESPYRTVAEPFSWYVTDRLKQWPHEVTVIVPTVEVRRWWQRPLVNQSLKRLHPLIGRRRTVELVEQPFPLG